MNRPTIGIPTVNGLLFCLVEDIICLIAEGSYTHLVMREKKRITLAKKLGDLADILPEQFLRIHHSHIVNLQHVVKFVKENNGLVVLTNGEELSVSKQRKKAFLEKYIIL
jgi:two-component system LytT family response regulator